MEQWVWWLAVLHLAVAGSTATVGSLNLQWFWQDRSERVLGWTGVLCWAVTLVLLVGAVGLSFPFSSVWFVVLPVRALLIGVVLSVFLLILGELVPLRGVRAAVIASLALPIAFDILGRNGSLAYIVVPGSPWPDFQPVGNVLVGGSLLLIGGYTVAALTRLHGARRRQLAAAMLTAAALVTVAVVTGPGLVSEAMTTLWTLPIAVLFASWCSSRVMNLQGSLNSAVEGRRLAEIEIEYQSRHDLLTGLPNLTAAGETLQALIDSADPAEFTMLYQVQVNRLDHVRAAAGAQGADQLLCNIADHLVAVLPADAAVAKIGESTFVVMAQVRRNRPVSYHEASVRQQIAMLRRTLQLPTDLSVVVGIAFGSPGTTAGRLLHRAGIAVTAAEQTLRPVQLFSPELQDGIVRRARTIRLLTAAVDRDEFELHYQPVVETSSLTQVSVEALVRWRHHGRLHPPGEWIPIAEEQGLMPAIGATVLRMAARDHAALRCPVAVNVSARQLEDPRFAATVLSALGDCPPSAIILELTESSLLTNLDRAYLMLETLRGHGIRVAVDDFGTEYSSLSRLAALPFDVLKIDRSFVTRVHSKNGRAMVTAIHAMAGGLGKTTVAEGVETLEQLEILREIGCDYVQGYLTGRPASLTDLLRQVGNPVGQRGG